ncbi:hypothetical protein [Rhodococcus sp. BP22]|uniref:hypothetical protein n=1 Tax=Rhodococcus sp. BP22 TaxID=2758566 RepID=UPI001648732A|nr:hypothetical protein [Rhodococcus sp. BP22]
MSGPRGIVAGTLAATAIAWAPYVLFPGTGIAVPMVQSVLYAALLVLTIRSRRLKVLLVRGLQRWTINPLMRGFLAIATSETTHEYECGFAAACVIAGFRATPRSSTATTLWPDSVPSSGGIPCEPSTPSTSAFWAQT